MGRPKSSPRAAQFCLVCGDVASGYHFNALSCENCKSFWRRNAIRFEIDSLRCKQNDNCLITVKSRKQCKKCRLKKCEAAGMLKAWILTEEDKKSYRNSRFRKRLLLESQETGSPESASSPLSSHASASPTPALPFLTYCLLNDHFDAIDLSLPKPSVLPRTLNPFPSHSLTEPERNLITELTTACSSIVNTYQQIREYSRHYLPVGSKPIAPYSFNRILTMARSLRAFAGLSESEQLTVLQKNLIDIFVLRTVLIYDSTRECWRLADDQNRVSVMAPLRILQPFCVDDAFEKQKNLPRLFREEWKRDRNIFDILTVVVLFTPPGSDADHQILDEQHRYCRLLARYLLCEKYKLYYNSLQVAEESYYRILANVDEMRQLTVGFWNMLSNYRDAFRGCPLLWRMLNDGRR